MRSYQLGHYTLMPRSKYADNVMPGERDCVHCGCELHESAFPVRTDKSGRVRRTHLCRACLRMRRQGRPGLHAAKAILEVVRTQPCRDCGGSFPPAAMQLVPPDGEPNPTRFVGRLALHRIEPLLRACTPLCANCWAIRNARKRAAKPKPARLTGVNNTRLLAALAAEGLLPQTGQSLAETPREPDITEPHSLTPHRLNDLERVGKDLLKEVSTDNPEHET